MKKQTKMILTIILILIIVLFAILNVQTVSINFFGFGKLQLPMIVMLVLWILIGAAISFLLSTSSSIRNHLNSSKEKKASEEQIESLQHKIDDLTKKLNQQSLENAKISSSESQASKEASQKDSK